MDAPVDVCVGVALAVLVNVALGVGVPLGVNIAVADGVNGCVIFGSRVGFGMAGMIAESTGVLVAVAVAVVVGVRVGVVVSVVVALEVAVYVGLALGVFLRVALSAAADSRGVTSACENDFAADMLATPRKSIDTAQRRKYRTAPRNQGSFLFVFSILHGSHRRGNTPRLCGVHPSPNFEMCSVENCFWGIFPKPVFKIPGRLFVKLYTHHIKIDMQGQSTFLLAGVKFACNNGFFRFLDDGVFA